MREREEKLTPVYEPGGKAARWFDNFWYHHKWKVIVIAFIVITLIICSLQMCTRVESDVYILYAGPYKFGQTDSMSFESAFSAVTEDRTGDGRVLAELVDFYILSDEQINGQLDAMGEDAANMVVNYEQFASNREAFDQHIVAGDTVICLLDPHLYNSVYVLDDNGDKLSGFMKLSDVLGYTPENAYDEYSIRIGDTPLGQYFSVLSGMDRDTLLCIREMSSFSYLLGRKSTREYHEYCKGIFNNIFEFVPPSAE